MKNHLPQQGQVRAEATLHDHNLFSDVGIFPTLNMSLKWGAWLFPGTLLATASPCG